jgi:hypothetical protein
MKIFNRQFIPLSLFILFVLLTATLLLLPPENSLGHIIKGVFVHAALVQTGLILFSIAGILGVISFFQKKNSWSDWTLASQKAALTIWTLYILSSMIVTYLAWGVAIAWDEPRVRSSAEVWLLAILFFVLVMWIRNQKFTAIVNMTIAIATWILIKSAGMIRHPLDPIGTSDAIMFKIFYLIIFIEIFLISIQCTRLFFRNTRPMNPQ